MTSANWANYCSPLKLRYNISLLKWSRGQSSEKKPHQNQQQRKKYCKISPNMQTESGVIEASECMCQTTTQSVCLMNLHCKYCTHTHTGGRCSSLIKAELLQPATTKTSPMNRSCREAAKYTVMQTPAEVKQDIQLLYAWMHKWKKATPPASRPNQTMMIWNGWQREQVNSSVISLPPVDTSNCRQTRRMPKSAAQSAAS